MKKNTNNKDVVDEKIVKTLKTNIKVVNKNRIDF